ncbi:MAG: flippase [Deltaproteobacteria bacterium]|nr:flippase [Deltaproteobacteria bacterium]
MNGEDTRSHYKELTGHIGAAMLRQVAALLLSFALGVMLARLLGPEGNGRYAMALLLPALIISFLNMGIPSANVYFLGSRRVSLKQALWTSVRFWVAICGFGIPSAVLLVFWFGDTLFRGVGVDPLLIALLLFPVALLQNFYLSLLHGKQEFTSYNGALLVSPSAALVLVFFAVFVLDLEIVGALVGVIAAQLIGLVFVASMIHKRVRSEVAELASETYAKPCIVYGLKAHFSNVLTFLNYRIDIFLVNYFLDPLSTGVYVVAVNIAERLWILSQSVSFVLFPRLSELHRTEGDSHRLAQTLAKAVLVVTLAAVGILAVVSKPFIVLIFGPEYAGASTALLWLLPGIAFGNLSRVLSNDIAARGRPELNTYSAALEVGINLAANLVLIPKMGINGAALATTLAYTCDAAAKVAVFSHLNRSRWWELFVPGRDDRHLLGLAIGGIRSWGGQRNSGS